jgi:DNA-binding MarR family transcriptional regulator
MAERPLGYRPLGYLLSECANGIRTATGHALDEYAVLPREFGLMLLIDEHGSMNQRRLGNLHRMDRTSVTKHLDRLEQLGYIVRHPDPDDRRAHVITLTTLGTDTVHAGTTAVVTAERRWSELLDDREREQLRALLAKALGEPDRPDDHAGSPTSTATTGPGRTRR